MPNILICDDERSICEMLDITLRREGYKVETVNSGEMAKRKLESKNCDMVVGNLVGGSDTGFESDENEVVLVMRAGETITLPRAPKLQIANRIFDEVLKLRLALHATHGR